MVAATAPAIQHTSARTPLTRETFPHGVFIAPLFTARFAPPLSIRPCLGAISAHKYPQLITTGTQAPGDQGIPALPGGIMAPGITAHGTMETGITETGTMAVGMQTVGTDTDGMGGTTTGSSGRSSGSTRGDCGRSGSITTHSIPPTTMMRPTTSPTTMTLSARTTTTA